jgi:hypothetical protein
MNEYEKILYENSLVRNERQYRKEVNDDCIDKDLKNNLDDNNRKCRCYKTCYIL